MPKKRVELTPAQKKAMLKERVYAMHESGMSVPEIERITGKPHSTIYRWINNYKTTDAGAEIEQKRAYHKEQLVDDAWASIGGVMLATKIRVARIRDAELRAEDIIRTLQYGDEETGALPDENERERLLKELETLKTASVGELTSLLNTLYEKQASASGEELPDNKIEIVIRGDMKKWGG